MLNQVRDLCGPFQALFAALKVRDSYTAHHSNRTTDLACALGMRCGLDERQLGILAMGAALHDIGKIGVADAVLLKPGPLTKDEWEMMKRHSDLGAQIVSLMDDDRIDDVTAAVRHHHEGFDGSGYPDGLAGENIPVLARVITLADSYDAMATRRPYRNSLAHAQILDIMRGPACGQYDPWMLDKFLQLIDTSPYRADRYRSE